MEEQSPFSADGNYRPLAKTRQQNISMQRQEKPFKCPNSYVEEKEQWQEQINQLKKQLDFSVNICQTLMQDQQVKFTLQVNFFNLVFEAVHIFFKSSVTVTESFFSLHRLYLCLLQTLLTSPYSVMPCAVLHPLKCTL